MLVVGYLNAVVAGDVDTQRGAQDYSELCASSPVSDCRFARYIKADAETAAERKTGIVADLYIARNRGPLDSILAGTVYGSKVIVDDHIGISGIGRFCRPR